jgi:polyisoprenoid-binding protein YceI
MYRVLTTAALVTFLAGPVLAADQKFTLTGENTKVTFVGYKPNGKHEGGFAKLAGTATVTDGKPETLQVEVTIETDSLHSDDTKLTGHLKSPDFFAVKDHPKAAFKSTKVEKTRTGYNVTGDLTMLGKTKAVTFPATVTVTGDSLLLTSEFKINRNHWGMSYGAGKINDMVDLKVNVNAKK